MTSEQKRVDWLLKKAQDADLNAWEDSFVADLLRRWERSGGKMTLSERQLERLEPIGERT